MFVQISTKMDDTSYQVGRPAGGTPRAGTDYLPYPLPFLLPMVYVVISRF